MDDPPCICAAQVSGQQLDHEPRRPASVQPHHSHAPAGCCWRHVLPRLCDHPKSQLGEPAFARLLTAADACPGSMTSDVLVALAAHRVAGAAKELHCQLHRPSEQPDAPAVPARCSYQPCRDLPCQCGVSWAPGQHPSSVPSDSQRHCSPSLSSHPSVVACSFVTTGSMPSDWRLLSLPVFSEDDRHRGGRYGAKLGDNHRHVLRWHGVVHYIQQPCRCAGRSSDSVCQRLLRQQPPTKPGVRASAHGCVAHRPAQLASQGPRGSPRSGVSCQCASSLGLSCLPGTSGRRRASGSPSSFAVMESSCTRSAGRAASVLRWPARPCCWRFAPYMHLTPSRGVPEASTCKLVGLAADDDGAAAGMGRHGSGCRAHARHDGAVGHDPAGAQQHLGHLLHGAMAIVDSLGPTGNLLGLDQLWICFLAHA